MTDRWFTASDGTRLWYEIHGEPGDGPTLLLADGIGCDGYIWRYALPALTPRGQVIHLHMRGHGLSDPPADPDRARIQDHADDWRELMDALGITDAVAIGHSMGVQVCLELWRRDGARIKGLVLMAGSYGHPLATFRDGHLAERILPVIQRVVRLGGRPLAGLWRRGFRLPLASYIALMTEMHPDLTRRADVTRYLDHMAQMDPGVFFTMLGEAGRHSAGDWLAQIDVPVLVIAGENDQFTPARLSAEMAERIPDATLLTVEDGAHACPIEHPTQVNLAVQDFLDRL
ncbi:MAG: alpha/beta hydrolase [Myxococcales bacterium]|nr:alpha/beta hydrolase [Myxococcales bacterium]MCB9522051.1 alpha/beta hydrolase [Myxococcales bacterium]